ncbi:Methionine-R-sulfoxide reductase B1-A [Merluccius polli]|uniref:Methionine-R-sulfoxide reductase B1-A n=1 Tax=Merluccius polli TaxID=89951 RepID=A0AA47P9C3_MERPO|nr:Methionine-R-sulfoxide reductase B1-A [Merluccius polli]
MSFCSFSGGEVYKNNFSPGLYVCAKCDHQLFSSRSKFEHSSPWPAFTDTVHEDSVAKHKERAGAFKISGCVRCSKAEIKRSKPGRPSSPAPTPTDCLRSAAAQEERGGIFKDRLGIGVYVCSECGHELFSSTAKFQHSSPWPAFTDPVHRDSVSRHPEAWGPLKIRLMASR